MSGGKSFRMVEARGELMIRKVQNKTPHLNLCGALLSTAVLKC
ncbi:MULTISPECIES: hypothetical protein [unclassified Bradyrhizobium]|nr:MULTISPECIES: hypothetical protein [unclassified Bradyrhizobium]